MPIQEPVQVECICLVCHAPFTWIRKWEQVETREACSRRCMGKLGQMRKQGLLPNILEEERVCAKCGKHYTAKRRSQSIAFPRFCSTVCANKGGGDQKRDDSWEREQERSCEVCGKIFTARRRSKDRPMPTTCSMECQGEKRESKLKRACRYCGGIFYQQRSVVKRGGNGGCFCSIQCYDVYRHENENPLAIGRKIDKGYILLYKPDHPSVKTTKRKYIYEHRLVMEQMLGRHLEPHENVHHIDGNRANNTPENLELWVSPQPSGQRIRDVYKQDVERLGRENLSLKHRIADLEAEIASLRRCDRS